MHGPVLFQIAEAAFLTPASFDPAPLEEPCQTNQGVIRETIGTVAGPREENTFN